jgi:hypothetical protein
MMCNPSVAPDPRPAKLLRAQLAYARRQGLDFDTAWALSMAAAAGSDKWWHAAFTWSREEWRACYERRPQTPAGNVVELLELPSVGGGWSASPDDLTAA